MSLSALLYCAYERLWTLPTAFKDLTGRTVIITGSNVGLGFEAAKFIYEMNPAQLILAVRSSAKGEQAKKEILSSATKPALHGESRTETKVDVWELDLASFASVRRFSQRCITELKRLDILLENAGIAVGKWGMTEDGWESTIQINVISTFMLAALLMPLLEKTAKTPSPVPEVHLKPHLVILASDIHFDAVFAERGQPHILDALNDEAQYQPRDRYRTSKLLDILVTRELANQQMFQNGDVVLCSLNPGLCRSELMRDFPPVRRWLLYTLAARSTREGSKNLLWAAVEDIIPPGGHISSCAVTNPSRFVLSPEGAQAQKKLWKELGDIVVGAAPEAAQIWTA